MRVRFYKLYLDYLFVVKTIYRKKSRENNINANVLSFLLLSFNLHSIILILELGFDFNFGLSNFWKPSSYSKVGYGYLLGAIGIVICYGVIYLLGIRYVKEKTGIFRQVIHSKKPRLFSIIYLIFSILFFVVNICWMAVNIIPM